MNSRQRFQNTFDHKNPDRVAIDYLAHPEIDRALRQALNVNTERELLDTLGCDFYYLSCRDISQNESLKHIYKGPALEYTETTRTCPFGIKWKRGAFGSKFAVDTAIGSPLASARSPRDVLDYDWPKIEHFDLEPFLAECEQFSDKVIIGGFWSGILGDCYRMMGFENFLFALAANVDLVKALVSRMTDFYCQLNEKTFQLLNGKLDIWFFGNDFGTQTGLLFSKEMFADIFLPQINKLCELARGYNVKVMMHSCGSILEIIPLLIEAGVQILDPLQFSAENMDPGHIKNTFGDKLVLHGGIDTQHVLPELTPDQVAQSCREMIDLLGTDGGYIFAPGQILDPKIPIENIIEMYRTGREHKPAWSK